MPEELQNLLDRIQKDGVKKAEAEAETIISSAREQAKEMLRKAEDNAEEIRKQAEQDAHNFLERSKKTLEQSARDVVLSVENAVQTALQNIVSQETAKSMSGDTLKKMLTKAVESYCDRKTGSNRIDVLLNPEEQKEITKFFISKYAKAMKKGLEIKADNSIVAGFKVSVVDQQVEHNFSNEAITEALCHILRPHLAEIVRNALAAEKKTKSGQTSKKKS